MMSMNEDQLLHVSLTDRLFGSQTLSFPHISGETETDGVR